MPAALEQIDHPAHTRFNFQFVLASKSIRTEYFMLFHNPILSSSWQKLRKRSYNPLAQRVVEWNYRCVITPAESHVFNN